MTVLPLPGLMEPPLRPALVRTAGTVAAAGDIDALVAELRKAARAAAETSRARSTERASATIGATFVPSRVSSAAPHPAEPETGALYATDLARRGRDDRALARVNRGLPPRWPDTRVRPSTGWCGPS
jgi:hypothetical protein